MVDDKNPGGVFAARGDLPKPITTGESLEISRIFTQHLTRATFRDACVEQDKYLKVFLNAQGPWFI
eukprot:14903886-Alexandrium_andersonii.AAC.1